MKTDPLMLHRALGDLHPDDYVDWAVERLCEGTDSPNLRILAGLHKTLERDEIEPFFRLACHDLQLQPLREKAPARDIARLIHESYRQGELSATDFVDMMADLHTWTEHNEPLLSFWVDMREELELEDSDVAGVCYPPEALASLDQAVNREWELFLRGCELNPSPESRYYIQCDDCEFIGEPAMKLPGLLDRLTRRHQFPIPTCAQCGSPHYTGMVDPQSRAAYYDQLALEQSAPPRHS